jgi:peptidylprolyl isomerase/peptidyl-prolyl cis-trans isomerase B (cyclophilin B)
MIRSFLRSVIFLVIIISSFQYSCTNKKAISEKNSFVLIETDLGNIKIMLFNETPIHRDNFIKLANENFYDGIIFHRVINSFMIQGGDPSTKPSSSQQKDTLDDTGYVLDAEFIPHLYHKKGALAAARMGDSVNPKKESSGSQFYIVQGKVFTPDELNMLEVKRNENLRKSTLNNLILDRANKLIDEGQNPDFNKIKEDLKDTIDIVIKNLPVYKYSADQIEIYTSIGGTPHLDGDYTVFGEVIEGLDIVDKIAAVTTDGSDRPLKDIRMKVKVISK